MNSRTVMPGLLLAGCLVSCAGCDEPKKSEPAAKPGPVATEAHLAPAEAEKLLSDWSSRLRLGGTNCLMEFGKATPGEPLEGSGAGKPLDAAPPQLATDGERITLHGGTAERCAKALVAAKVLATSSCWDDSGNNACGGPLQSRTASAYCDADPCRIVFGCGSSKMEGLSITTEGAHATLRFRVVGAVDLTRHDGCPPSRRASEDQAWLAKATRDDAGKWSLDAMPEAAQR